MIGVLSISIFPQSPNPNPQSPILKTPRANSNSPLGIFSPIGDFHFKFSIVTVGNFPITYFYTI